MGASDAAQTLLDHHIYAGTATRAGLCISPKLQEWVAQELSKESAVLKERRKAREERQLRKPA